MDKKFIDMNSIEQRNRYGRTLYFKTAEQIKRNGAPDPIIQDEEPVDFSSLLTLFRSNASLYNKLSTYIRTYAVQKLEGGVKGQKYSKKKEEAARKKRQEEARKKREAARKKKEEEEARKKKEEEEVIISTKKEKLEREKEREEEREEKREEEREEKEVKMIDVKKAWLVTPTIFSSFMNSSEKLLFQYSQIIASLELFIEEDFARFRRDDVKNLLEGFDVMDNAANDYFIKIGFAEGIKESILSVERAGQGQDRLKAALDDVNIKLYKNHQFVKELLENYSSRRSMIGSGFNDIPRKYM
jgi:flagellar biosynthesis GTPase FlhF